VENSAHNIATTLLSTMLTTRVGKKGGGSKHDKFIIFREDVFIERGHIADILDFSTAVVKRKGRDRRYKSE